MKRVDKTRINDKRDNFIVDAINSGLTATKIGREFQLSRERICQIYYKKTGISLRERELDSKLREIKNRPPNTPKLCDWCHKPINHRARRFHYPECYLKFRQEWQKRYSHDENIKRIKTEYWVSLTKEMRGES